MESRHCGNYATLIKCWEEPYKMTNQEKAASAKAEVVFGPPREAGTAGPDASYVVDELKRWRLRGDGVLSNKKKK